MPKPEAEPLLPRISLSWLIGLVTVSAVVMAVVLRAVVSGSTWSVLGSVMIASVFMPLLMYAGTFALASLFSVIGSAAIPMEKPAPVYRPSTRMPSLESGVDLFGASDDSGSQTDGDKE